ncbi:hypothetical protein FOA52_009383 [Chlamydomonas sp. UWO 241]|nr:hypothetical protein FOA52_009383 [Chlamydomonas sp. UWO 241]
MEQVAPAAVPATPPKYHMLTCTYVADILEKRGPYRAEHIAGCRSAVEAGKMLMAGALGDPPEGLTAVWRPGVTVDEIRAFVEADAYVKNGLVTAWTIKPLTVVAGP